MGDQIDNELHNRIRIAAHDVRTPITSIAGFAELLVDDPALSPTAREHAETILGEARRLSRLLEDFFDEVSATPE